VNHSDFSPSTAIVIGASGQDGYFLTERLLNEDWKVHALARQPGDLAPLARTVRSQRRLQAHSFDVMAPQTLFDLIAQEPPAEIYNLAGQSSVAISFAEPLLTWRTNAEFVAALLECVRMKSPLARLYQASSTEMFGVSAADIITYNEESALNPQSPYASAKAAAHLLCRSYRKDYNLRIACGILSNHESHRRPISFLSHKVVAHVARLKELSAEQIATSPPLALGNLKVQRDWGFAPDYVAGMCKILRQIEVRADRTGESLADAGSNYRDYLLATGKNHAVWELVDCAFRIGGFELEWDLQGEDFSSWRGYFSSTGKPAVVVDPRLFRTADPLVIQVDPSRARKELGWMPKEGLEVFLQDMFDNLSRVAAVAKGCGAIDRRCTIT
jgi:GDPmannose 4,6-dehydratase